MKKGTIAAIAATTAVVLGGGVAIGTAMYNNSVREQICLSYERQGVNNLEGSIKNLSKVYGMVQEVQQNPFMGFAYFGKLMELKEVVEQKEEQTNDWRYAYEKTCGSERVDKWLDTSEVKALTNRLFSLTDNLSR
jgi:hypothetical protein